MTCGLTPAARGGSGAKGPPLAARPKWRVLVKIPKQLKASFLIFLTLGSHCNTLQHTAMHLEHTATHCDSNTLHYHDFATD